MVTSNKVAMDQTHCQFCSRSQVSLICVTSETSKKLWLEESKPKHVSFFLYAVKPRDYIESTGTGNGGFLDFYFHFKTFYVYFASKFSTSLF